ncbi:hypothetical protein P7K49_021807 [Saguinus oedipus]|uniref:Uncharacterized protein n=1 Tax=Saguinus oedipus TaxID=9490 RepID=A0ABQ9UTN9_SAGOE|nr:hypothetical protein P7K49_021807 [Saguinus oedipus]
MGKPALSTTEVYEALARCALRRLKADPGRRRSPSARPSWPPDACCSRLGSRWGRSLSCSSLRRVLEPEPDTEPDSTAAAPSQPAPAAATTTTTSVTAAAAPDDSSSEGKGRFPRPACCGPACCGPAGGATVGSGPQKDQARLCALGSGLP